MQSNSTANFGKVYYVHCFLIVPIDKQKQNNIYSLQDYVLQ